jgi:hypothetical protein
MLARQLRAALSLFAVTALLAVGSCSDSSPAPTPIATPRPGVPTGPAVVSLQLGAPESLEPGTTAQLTVTALRSDGSSEALTSGLQWFSSNPRVLRVDSQGVATAFAEAGESRVMVSANARSASKAILVLPNGTFRLRGQIVEGGAPVDGASVAVIAGTGEGLTTLTDPGGRYSLYGVAGSIKLRGKKAGYQDLTQDVHVTGHSTHDMTMVPERPRVSLAGQYQLILTATGCSAIPSELRRRTYDARLEQQGARLTVTLSGADLIAADGATRLTGVFRLDGRVAFEVGSFLNYYYYWYSPLASEIVERISPTSALVINGTSNTTDDGNGVIAGTLSGVFATTQRTTSPFWPYSASCNSSSHGFELRRQ